MTKKYFDSADESGTIKINKNKIELVHNVLTNMQQTLSHVIELLETEKDGLLSTSDLEIVTDKLKVASMKLKSTNADLVLEGVFDGEKMIAHNGEVYEVPANYASKSKLIEGDILKLTITKNKDYIFKQISPIERKRVVGTLGIDTTSGQYYVMADSTAYRVIPASVTYFKGEVGDEVVLLVPLDGTSAWAAIENIIKK